MTPIIDISQKRILIFSLAFWPYESGAEIAPRKVTERMPQINFDVITYRFDKKWPAVEKKNNITIYRVGGPTKYGYIVQALLKSLWLNRKNNYKAVWSIMASYSGGSALMFKIIHPKIPLILTLQEGDPVKHILRRVFLLRPLFRLLFKKTDKVQAISNYLAGFAKDMGYVGQVAVIPNGVDFNVNENRSIPKKTLQSKEKVILISNSRLVKKNGLDIIIKSLKYLPNNIVFKNVGDGSEKESLEKLVTDEGLLDRVKFDDAVSNEKAIDYLKQGDIFVRPSRSEGLGSSFLEAMAIEIPIIATDVGGIKDFLVHGQTGLVCQVDNPQDLAQKVLMMIKDQILVENIVQNAKKLVLTTYNWDSIAMKFKDKIFNEI